MGEYRTRTRHLHCSLMQIRSERQDGIIISADRNFRILRQKKEHLEKGSIGFLATLFVSHSFLFNNSLEQHWNPTLNTLWSTKSASLSLSLSRYSRSLTFRIHWDASQSGICKSLQKISLPKLASGETRSATIAISFNLRIAERERERQWG